MTIQVAEYKGHGQQQNKTFYIGYIQVKLWKLWLQPDPSLVVMQQAHIYVPAIRSDHLI